MSAPAPKCVSCRFWNKQHHDLEPGQGQCMRIASCIVCEPASAGQILATVTEYGRLLTRPDFGCVLWEMVPGGTT